MSKRDTFHSFQDIGAARLRRAGEVRTVERRPEGGKKNADPEAPALEDESALFLAAVAKNVDVSLKNPAPEDNNEPSPSPKNTPGAAQPAGTARSAQAPALAGPEETSLFSQAMANVTPIRARGRELAPSVPPPPAGTSGPLESMDEIFSAKLEFSLEHTDEFIQGHVLGVDPAVLGKLRAGAYSPEGHVDLHGQNMEQAYATLAAFIKHAYQSGKRHLLVITGRGRNSPGGTAVLRERVQAWFTRDPFKRVVLAFCTARPADGGAGAVYLLLRKRKKHQGKIIWDRKPSEEELLL